MNFFEKTKKWWVLIGIGLSTITVAIDFTIVNIALPVIQKGISAKTNELQWFMAAFGISFATLLTIMGRLGDLFGRRLLTYIGMGGFLLCSIGAGLSAAPLHLIFFRFFQGVFAAAIAPCSMMLIADAFPEKEQGKAIGIFGSFFGCGLALGPVIGGFIITFLNWPWIFFINVPIILLSFIISLPLVQETKKIKQSIDVLGLILFIFSVGSLVFAFTEGPTLGWSSSPILITLIGGFLLFLLFLKIETKAKNPLCPLYLFKQKGFFIGSICYVAAIACVWPLLFLLPLYLQNILHYSPAESGFILLAMTAMTVIGSPLAGYILDRKGEKIAIYLLFASLFIGYILQLFFGWDGPLWLILLAFIIFGYGWGAGNGISTPIAIAHLTNRENNGVIAGALLTILNTTAVLLLSVIISIFRHGEKMTLHEKGVPIEGGFILGFRLSILVLIFFTLILFALVIRPLFSKRN